MLLIPVPSSAQGINPCIFFPAERALQPEGLLHSRGMAGSGLPPLSKIPHCCLPQESGPCLSSSVADHPLRPATDRRLGELLPHQLANLISAAQSAQGLAIPCFPAHRICGISVTFATLSPTEWYVPIHYSPVRHSSAEQAPCYRSTCMCKACRQRSI